MITGKQRATLRSMANDYQPVVYIGKLGLTDNLLKEVSDALEAHELIKIKIQDMAPLSVREAADQISEKLTAEIVSCVGSKFVLFRTARKPENRKIKL